MNNMIKEFLFTYAPIVLFGVLLYFFYLIYKALTELIKFLKDKNK